MTHRVGIIGGDGIGPEVVAEARKVVRAAGGGLDAEEYDLGTRRYLDPGGGHDLAGLGHHLGADAVAADDPDPMGHCAFLSAARTCAHKRTTAHRGGRSRERTPVVGVR